MFMVFLLLSILTMALSATASAVTGLSWWLLVSLPASAVGLLLLVGAALCLFSYFFSLPLFYKHIGRVYYRKGVAATDRLRASPYYRQGRNDYSAPEGPVRDSPVGAPFKDWSKPDHDLRTEVGKNSDLKHHSQRLARYRYTRVICSGALDDDDGFAMAGVRPARRNSGRGVSGLATAIWVRIVNFANHVMGYDLLEVERQDGKISLELLFQLCNPHNMSPLNTPEVAAKRIDQTARTQATMPLCRSDIVAGNPVVEATTRFAFMVFMDAQRRTRRIPFPGSLVSQ